MRTPLSNLLDLPSLEVPFAQYLRVVGYSKSTCHTMSYALNEFAGRVKKPLQEINKQDIDEYTFYLESRPNHRRSGGLSSSMLRHYLYGLKVFFNWCEQTGKLKINPMSGHVLPVVETMERVILSREEVSRLYGVCEDHRDRSLLGIYYGCGLRRSEGEALNGKDIDFGNGLLYVRSGKGGKRRVVPLSNGVRWDLLRYYRDERDGHDQEPFLLNNSGTRMRGSTSNKRLKELVEKAGINKSITLHSLRHSIATHLLHQGLSLEQVRDFLGHAHLETTQIYTHYDTKKLPP